jgi:hypothetical protein
LIISGKANNQFQPKNLQKLTFSMVFLIDIFFIFLVDWHFIVSIGGDNWGCLHGGFWSAREKWRQPCARDCQDVARVSHILQQTFEWWRLAYMVVSGLPEKNGNNHVREIARMSLE